MQTRQCLHCSKEFKPKSPNHLFCNVSHTNQYNKGKTWESYFRSLLNNNAKERKELSVEYLMRLFKKQKGRCALSGVTLTKTVGVGPVTSNASIDRKKPDGKYTKRNVRLVCVFVNSFRGNVLDKELKWWAGRIFNYGK